MNYKRILEMLEEYGEDIKNVSIKVLEAEEEKISLKNPRGIKDDIKGIINEVIDYDNQ